MRRTGLGPVFYYEWLTGSRRWQMFAGRAAFVGLLLAALLLVGWRVVNEPTLNVAAQQSMQNRLARVGEALFYGIIGTQLAVVLLAAPAATAGSVCNDKARGGLVQLLVTDLSDTEIILGKLAARLLPVLGLILAGAPVLFLSLFLGGIDPGALVGATLVTVGVAVFACSLTLLLSVWGTKTHEVLVATYLILSVLLLVSPTWWTLAEVKMISLDLAWGQATIPVYDGLRRANPFWLAFAPYSDPGVTGVADALWFLAGSCLAAAALTGLAVACVRRAALRQAASPGRKRFRWSTGGRGLRARAAGGPSLDANPVLWREWHRRRLSRWGRAVGGVYGVLAVGFTLLAVGHAVWTNSISEFPALVNGVQVSFGLLLVSVSAVTCLAEERVRGSLDVLLTTPLPTWKIVVGKWWGAFRTVPRLTFLPAFVLCALALRAGHWEIVPLVVGLILAYGAALASLGLAMAVWVRRLGRAVAASVTVYVAVTVGWVFVVFTLLQGIGEAAGLGFASASPFYGVGLLTIATEERFGMERHRGELVAMNVGWLVLYAAAAGLLLWVTLATFDRCLGRVGVGAPAKSPKRERGRSESLARASG